MDVRVLFNALSDPTRLAIVERLVADGALSVGTLAEPFAMSVPAVSQHLRILRESGLVLVQREAQRRFYSVNRPALAMIANWADQPGAVPQGGGLRHFMAKRAAIR